MSQQFNTPEENRLIEAASRGDKAAFGQIMEMYEKLVYNTIRTKVQNAEDAMDLSQEVFIKLWRSIGHYRGDCRFSTWLYKIAVNASLDFLRRAPHVNAEPLPSVTDDDGEEKMLELPDESIAASPERTLDKAETVRVVRDAIAQLNAEQQEVILLRDIEGYTYEEISEMLSLEIGTVKSRINRARSNLRELLSAFAGKLL